MDHNLGRNPAGVPINLQSLGDNIVAVGLQIASIGHTLEGLRHRAGNIQKADPTVKEGGHGGLIGRIEGGGRALPEFCLLSDALIVTGGGRRVARGRGWRLFPAPARRDGWMLASSNVVARPQQA